MSASRYCSGSTNAIARMKCIVLSCTVQVQALRFSTYLDPLRPDLRGDVSPNALGQLSEAPRFSPPPPRCATAPRQDRRLVFSREMATVVDSQGRAFPTRDRAAPPV